MSTDLLSRIQALEHENQLLRMAIDESPDVILLKDADGKFLLCNQTLAQLYGTTPQAVVGKSDGDFSATPEQDAFFRENVKSIMRSGITQVVMEESTDDRTGETRYFKSIKKPFKDNNGTNCILVIAHDVTDIRTAQAKVEASERQLGYALHAAGEGLWDWDIASGQLKHNARWYDLLGYSESDMTGAVNDFFRLLHPDELPEIEERIQLSLKSGVPYHHEHRMLHQQGHWIWVLDRGEVVERDADGQPLRMVGSFSNIQHRKQVEFDLVEAKIQAETANKAKSFFLANMSHEIRTPMNGILGMLSLLETSGLNEAQKEQAALIRQSTDALVKLIDEILDLSKIEAGKLELRSEAVNVPALVAECVQLHAPLAKAKGLQLSFDIARNFPNLLWSDAERLRQVINNLLNNALKFTADGSVRVAVQFSSAQWRCEIVDTGIGIDQSQLPQLFKPFTQADGSSTRHYGGTGLGLSICKRLVEAMGGTIGVTSSQRQGSCFWFELPLSPTHVAGPQIVKQLDALPIDAVTLTGRVLVVEDHPLNQKMILAMLSQLSLEAVLADNGLTALQLLRESRFDLVLMDCQMPVMDGYEAVTRIRNGEAGSDARDIGILALTANAMAEDVKRCEELGFNMHIAKPFTLATIQNALRMWLPAISEKSCNIFTE